MKLTSVKVENYKLCRDVTIQINDKLTVLLGKNGSGKTTLLSALSFLSIQSDVNPGRSRHFMPKDYDVSSVTAEIEDGKRVYILFAKVYFDKNSIPTNPRYIEHSLSVDGGKRVEYNDFEYYFFSNRMILDEIKTGNSPAQIDIFKRMMAVKDFINDVVSVQTTDFLHGDENDTMLDVSPRSSMGGSRHSRRANSKFLMALYELKNTDPNGFERYRGVVSRTGSGLIDNIDFNSISVPKSSVKAYKNGKLTTIEESRDLVVPIFSIGGNKLYSNQLSEGTFRVLALIFYIMNSDSKILIIEEPELSIHVNLLADVIELVKEASKHCHVILSTHSEKIVNMLSLDDVVLVSRGGNGIEAQRVDDKFSHNNLESLKKYLTDGGTLGEFLLGD
ncbi:MAG TPA: AAA family ATPase [Candidatus Saccharimonadales bacterium]